MRTATCSGRGFVPQLMPEIPANFVLDHIQNREAIRLREYSHPYLRLCPISSQVNTSGGTNTRGVARRATGDYGVKSPVNAS